MTKKRILIAPLDWGLGHAARCIPIVRYLLEKDCEVIIAADKRPMELLKKEFPSLEFVVMPGYEISYPKNGSMVLKIAVQVPKILIGIKREHKLLKKIIREKKIDAVISDNRFGLWSRSVPCVFITHQLMVKAPFGEKLLHKLNKNLIAKYNECWIPDNEGENNLSGDLSHKFPLPENAKFIGILSRFNSLRHLSSKEEPLDLLVLLSGPEPQRPIFEKKILEQISFLPIKSLIVQGITEKNETKKISENVEIVSFLTSDDLIKKILSSKIILCRPGYSSVMDLAALGKKSIFVSTPGQPEQEYFAKYFSERRIAYSVAQKEFDLKTALEESKEYLGFSQTNLREGFKVQIDALMLSLK